MLCGSLAPSAPSRSQAPVSLRHTVLEVSHTHTWTLTKFSTQAIQRRRLQGQLSFEFKLSYTCCMCMAGKQAVQACKTLLEAQHGLSSYEYSAAGWNVVETSCVLHNTGGTDLTTLLQAPGTTLRWLVRGFILQCETLLETICVTQAIRQYRPTNLLLLQAQRGLSLSEVCAAEQNSVETICVLHVTRRCRRAD